MVSVADAPQLAARLIELVTARLVTPLLILFIGIIAGKVAGNLVDRIGRAVELDKHGRNAFSYRAEYTEVFAGGVAAVIYTVAVAWALNAAQVLSEALWAVLAFLGLFAVLGVALWLWDFLPNWWAGRSVRKQLSVGDGFSGAGVSGTVTSVGVLGVTISSEKERTIVVPNATVRRSL